MSAENPRPGKLGDEITKAEVERLRQLYESQGYFVRQEDKIDTPGGHKSKRFLDIGLYVIAGAMQTPLAGKIISVCNGCKPEDWALAAGIAALGIAGRVAYDQFIRVRGINVGIKKKNGEPIKREKLAQQDIEQNWKVGDIPPAFEFHEKPKS